MLVNSPARNNRARLTASRRSVFIRSPLRRGINDGATTLHSIPLASRWRYIWYHTNQKPDPQQLGESGFPLRLVYFPEVFEHRYLPIFPPSQAVLTFKSIINSHLKDEYFRWSTIVIYGCEFKKLVLIFKSMLYLKKLLEWERESNPWMTCPALS